MRNCDAIADNMTAYQKLYNALEGSFDGCELNYITRANNTEADELVNIGSTRGPVPPDVFLESISQRSIKVQAAAPEAAMDGEDSTNLAQVAAASSTEDTRTSTPDRTRRTSLGKTVPPISNRRHATTRRGRSPVHQPSIQAVHSNQQTVIQAQRHADTP